MARGTIRARGKGRWQVQVSLGRDPQGRRRFRARTITGTRADADRALTALLAEADTGRLRPSDELTVTDLIDTWIRLEGPTWSPRTLRETRSVLDRHLGTLGQVRLDRLRAAQIADHLAALRDDGAGAPTVAKVHSRLRAALSAAVRLDLIATNPARNVRPPKTARPRSSAATVAQVAAVLQLLDDDPEMAAFVRLSAITGARRGEVCALRWDDIAAGAVTFTRSVIDAGPGHGLVVKDLKTDRPKRTALDGGTLAVLDRWHMAVQADDLAHDWQTPWVFPGDRDRSRTVRPDLMSKRWRRLCDQAGAHGLRLHDLRHGAATDLLEAGFSPVQVAGRLGHSRPSTTTDLYGHHAPAGDQALADALGSALDDALD